MTQQPNSQDILFAGSIATGKSIVAACAGTLIRVKLELGGKDTSIVCPDVDVAATALKLVMGAMSNSDQVCVATKRMFIHLVIYAPMLKAMTEFVETMKLEETQTA